MVNEVWQMFGFFKRRQPQAPSDTASDFPGANAAMGLVFLQLPLCGLDPLSLCAKLNDDDFALGYVFGVADMANYQFNRPAPGDQHAALTYIRHVFIETLGGDGEDRFMQALGRQSKLEFQAGRQAGADDMGEWVRSQGQRHAVGLSQHFSSLES